MPSPIGHALAGAAICCLSVRRPGWRLILACAVAAALPDIDLLYLPAHRTVTHSLPVGILVTIIAAVVTGWVRPLSDTGQTPIGQMSDTGRTRVGWRSDSGPTHVGQLSDTQLIGLAIGLAWTSHVLLDWLGADRNPPFGIQALWPFNDAWFFSGIDLFPGTERRDPLGARAMLINLRAAITELALMGPVALLAWWWTVWRRTV
jgi:membrane-bound metal-dependent hydrolase YbcI (DUF457 family)